MPPRGIRQCLKGSDANVALGGNHHRLDVVGCRELVGSHLSPERGRGPRRDPTPMLPQSRAARGVSGVEAPTVYVFRGVAKMGLDDVRQELDRPPQGVRYLRDDLGGNAVKVPGPGT